MGMSLEVAQINKHPNNSLNADYQKIGDALPLTEYMKDILYEYCSEVELFEKYEDEYESVIYRYLEEQKIINEITGRINELDNSLSERFKEIKGINEKIEIYSQRDNLWKINNMFLNYFIALRHNNELEIKLLIT